MSKAKTSVASKSKPAVAWSALLVWALSFRGIMALDDPRLRYPSFLLGALALGLSYLVLVSRAEQLSKRFFRCAVAVALLTRLTLIFEAPAFSDDIFRYIYEGRVVWHRGPGFPFRHPPADAPKLGVPEPLLDESWLRINHPSIATIYPPFAQSVFAIAGGLGDFSGGHQRWLKALLVLADLAVWLVLFWALRRMGASPARTLVWGLCPLVVLEIAREGHADSLSALGLALGGAGFALARPGRGYLGLGLAALAKLNGLLILPAALRLTRRGLWVFALTASGLAIPWLLVGTDAGQGLGAYASRWRAGDGLFSLLLMFAKLVLGGDWKQIGPITLTQHQLARGVVALLLGAYGLWLLSPRFDRAQFASRAGLLLFGVLLCAPTLHPWYITWVLPFIVLSSGFPGCKAVLLLVFLAPLLHHPGYLELLEDRWIDLGWVRALVHVPVWVLWAWELAQAGGFGYPRRTCPSAKA